MAVSVPDVMREVRNTFPVHCMEGTWTVTGGCLTPCDLLLEGDWIAVTAGARADGIRRVGPGGQLDDGGLPDETFTGEIWLLDPPEGFLALCGEIADWAARNSLDAVESRRFGDFSQRRALGRNGLPPDWPAMFRWRLMPYRRMFGEVGRR